MAFDSSASSRVFWRITVAVLATALLATTIFANTIPGLHFDEAWVLLRIQDITNGARPLSGMNFYTGALNGYLAWPFVVGSGYQVWGLRIACALSNAIALLFAMLILRVLHRDDPEIWGWTGVLWVTSVPFVLFSRFGVEMSMLMPVLVLGGVWLIAVALRAQSTAGSLAAGLGGGITLGLSVYNHAVALGVIAALCLGAVAGFGRELFKRRVSWFVVAGLCIGLLPTAIGLVTGVRDSANYGTNATPAPGSSAIGSGVWPTIVALATSVPITWGTIRDLRFLPTEMAGIVDGGLMFQRFTGERLVPVIPYFSLALVILGAARWWQARRVRLAPIDCAMLVAWLAMPICIVMMTPQLALGYFEFPALVAPYALVRFALPEKGETPRYRRVARGVLGAVLAIQIGYVTVDYFWAFSRSGGGLSYFPLGSRLTETSDHFVRSDRLYQQLVAARVREVTGPLPIVGALLGYDITSHSIGAMTELDSHWRTAASPYSAAGRVAIVDFADSNVQRFPGLGFGRLRYVRAPEFDPKFVVFICDRP